ncbi:hypothetical protein D2Q93_13495 [Alicyclobacillaceae bacterium I2511]|nr:hypothetical protein D2Q93_13495 [Alicyclobacillaceae bacterium I2511]
MGRDKLSLPLTANSQRTVLGHVVATAAGVADWIWLLGPALNHTGLASRNRYTHAVVGAAQAGQGLPAELAMEVIADEQPYQGPLVALAHGWMRMMRSPVPPPDWIWVLAGDLPGVQVEVLQTLAQALQSAGEGVDAVLAQRAGHWQPLLGCYRWTAGTAFVHAHAAGQRRLFAALEQLTLWGVDGLALGWPDWWLRPVHTPKDYQEWLDHGDQRLH